MYRVFGRISRSNNSISESSIVSKVKGERESRNEVDGDNIGKIVEIGIKGWISSE